MVEIARSFERPSIAARDFISVRGRQLPFDDLVDHRLFDPSHVDELRRTFRAARPFPHLVVEGWFNPVLLDVAAEEFRLFPAAAWRNVAGQQEHTYRSQPGITLGPAAQTYFWLVNSGWFVNLLSSIISVEDLIPDPQLFGGGLHETRNGGHFGIHRDFDRHVRTGLVNKMVLLTYLNRDWDPEWDGDLELWDGLRGKQVATVRPEFGRSLLMRHGPDSFHGHPRPLKMPDGAARRSLAAYYYSNPAAAELREKHISSVFFQFDVEARLTRLGKRWTPPAVWDLLKKARSHWRNRRAHLSNGADAKP